MSDTALIKAVLINAAYQGAGAVCAPLAADDGKPLPIDPLLQDAGLQKKGVLVYEEAKVQYHAILRAFHDQSGIWPDPKIAQVSPGPGPAAALSLPALLTQLLGLFARLPRDTPLGSVGHVLDLAGKFLGDVPKQPGQELVK